METGLRQSGEDRSESAAVLVLSPPDRGGEEEALVLSLECPDLVAPGLARVATVLRRLEKVLVLLEEDRVLSAEKGSR